MRSSTSRIRWKLVVMIVSLGVFGGSLAAFGQGFATAEFNGSVVDQSGAVLPGAAITLTEESTGLMRGSSRTTTGRFVLTALQPGVYTVRAELAGFQTQARTGIRLLVGQAVTVTLTLPVGTLTDQITVTGEAPLIEVTQTTLGSNLTTEDIENLPTQGREMLSLMQLIPGLTPQLEAGNFEGTTYSANGRENQSNLFLVDGVHNKDDRGGAFTQVSMTIDAFSEYNVMTHDYGAEYGGASGVIVNAVTKSGTNQFRGSGYYYGQDDNSTPPTTSRSWTAGTNRRAATTSLARASAGRSSGTRRSSFSTPSDSGSRRRSTCSFRRGGAAGDVLRGRLRRQPHQVLRTGGLPGDAEHNFGFRTIWNPNTGIGEVAEDEEPSERTFATNGRRRRSTAPTGPPFSTAGCSTRSS